MNNPRSWHVHVSEREPDGTWEDCTFDSGTEFARLCRDKKIPATHAESQATRAASGKGPTGGANIGDLLKGFKARYGWTVGMRRLSGFNTLWSDLTPGRAAVCQGSMSAFGPTHRLSRWDKNFDGGHAVLIARLDSTSRVWWCDPEAPKGSYTGEWVGKAELQRYVVAFAGEHLVATMLPEPPPPTTGDDMDLTSYTPGYVATIKPTGNIRSAPVLTSASFVRASKGEKATVIGTVAGALDLGSTTWYQWWEKDRYLYTHKTNVTALVAPEWGEVAPDPTPYDQAALDAAVAAQKAKSDATMAVHLETDKQSIATAKQDGVLTEKSRLRTFLGL